jgi:KTSC domain
MPSTVIRSYKYDPESHELGIVFQTRRRYTYKQVSPEIFALMKAAYSKGEFFNAHIRGKFPFVRETDYVVPERRLA